MAGAKSVRLTPARLIRITGGVFVALVLVAFIALSAGPQPISPVDIFNQLVSPTADVTHTILFNLRLPRILLAISVGGALASCGVIYQALLRNSLAEPYILGVSNGCAVGAILGYLLGIGQVGITTMSFVGGTIVIVTVLAISRGGYGERSESMLLGGVMVGAIAAALIFLLLHLLGDQIRSAVQWMLGDLGSASSDIGYASIALFALIFSTSFLGGNILNGIALGDEEARSLGLNVDAVRIGLYLVASFLVGAAVSFCGAIGFIGLVVPHILRRLVGPDHRILLPVSVLGGGIFLVLCDTIARTALPVIDSTGSELPVGAITALVGAPVFIYLLRRQNSL